MSIIQYQNYPQIGQIFIKQYFIFYYQLPIIQMQPHNEQKKFEYLKAVNCLRSCAKKQIPTLQKICASFKNQFQCVSEGKYMKTKEGKKLWIQAINFLNNQTVSTELIWSEILHNAAKNYVKYLDSQLKYDPFEFIEQEVDYRGEIKTWSIYNCTSINHFLNMAIISQGDPSRDQRRSLFNPKFKYFGSAISSRSTVVYFLAEEIYEKRKNKITANKIIKEINKIRSNPQSYIVFLEERLPLFKNKKIQLKQYFIQTSQGKTCYLECIQFLKNQRKVPQLQYIKLLNKIALKKSRYPTISFAKFLKKFDIQGKARFIENFGTADPKSILISLIVSDGDPKRSSRNSIFSQEFNSIGGYIDPTPHKENSGLLFLDLNKVLDPRFETQENDVSIMMNSQVFKPLLNDLIYGFTCRNSSFVTKMIQNRIKQSFSSKKLLKDSIRSTSTDFFKKVNKQDQTKKKQTKNSIMTNSTILNKQNNTLASKTVSQFSIRKINRPRGKSSADIQDITLVQRICKLEENAKKLKH